MKKTKSETDSLLRVPKAKNKLGLKINPIRMPHEDLIKPENPKLELVNDISTEMTSLTRHTSQTSQTTVAPTKDFQKVPNSIAKEAIPEGLFKQGKSKHLYDVLYSLTRGSIEPKRTVRLSKTKLRKLAGIGSRVTFDSCVNHLESVGLLKITVRIGEHEGNEFELFLPEETTLSRQTSLSSVTSLTRHAQKLDRLVCLETSQTSHSLNDENKDTYNAPKTSFKDYEKNDDDEPFGAMNKVLASLGEGKREDWSEIGQLLKMEFDIAASRTKSVTNAPKFLAEHLRRRLMPAKKEPAKSKPTKQTQAGHQKPAEPIEYYAAEPLTKEGRESTLKTFSGYIEKGQKEFLLSLEDTYTPEDWEWLKNELKL